MFPVVVLLHPPGQPFSHVIMMKLWKCQSCEVTISLLSSEKVCCLANTYQSLTVPSGSSFQSNTRNHAQRKTSVQHASMVMNCVKRRRNWPPSFLLQHPLHLLLRCNVMSQWIFHQHLPHLDCVLPAQSLLYATCFRAGRSLTSWMRKRQLVYKLI